MPSEKVAIVDEARAKLAKPGHGMGKRNRELINGLCDEVERLRMAVSHAIRRNHDYAPASCDGCADAEKSLTPKDHNA